ncbi:hypothetical protein [Flexithrix dorotheae]|uniref:hypothetical protein n=1 Tax=Flexithrix dorotheae TaxID=70993 RepID=UPI000368B926|nr:hypothetical protein [Flexithrix dorotheae]
MRKIVFILIILIKISSPESTAQVLPPPPDPVTTSILSKMLGIDIKSFAQDVETFQTLKTLSKDALAAKRNLEKIYRQQKEIRERLKNRENVKGLIWGDAAWAIGRTTGINMNPADYIPKTEWTNEMARSINQGYYDATTLKALNTTYNRISYSATSLKSTVESMQKKREMAELKESKKFDRAAMISELMKKNEERIMEINVILNDTSQIELTDGEILMLMNESVKLIRSNLMLQEDLDKIIFSEPDPIIKEEQEIIEQLKFKNSLKELY